MVVLAWFLVVVCFLCVFVLIEDTQLFAITYSPICGNSQSKTKRFDDRLSLERARHELKKKISDAALGRLRHALLSNSLQSGRIQKPGVKRGSVLLLNKIFLFLADQNHPTGRATDIFPRWDSMLVW